MRKEARQEKSNFQIPGQDDTQTILSEEKEK